MPLILVGCALLLAAGLTLPLLEVEKLYFWQNDYSVLSGIAGLYEDGELLLCALILFFSVLFPVFKLGLLAKLWFAAMTRAERQRWLARLNLLGKWSMLDVFVVAILVVAAKLGALAEVHPRPGVIVFCAAVLLSMLLTSWIEHLARAATSEA